MRPPRFCSCRHGPRKCGVSSAPRLSPAADCLPPTDPTDHDGLGRSCHVGHLVCPLPTVRDGAQTSAPVHPQACISGYLPYLGGISGGAEFSDTELLKVLPEKVLALDSV